MSGAMTPEYLDDLIRRALAEDAPWGDVTSEVFVPADARATATLSSREPGVLSGLTVFARVFQIVDASIGIDLLARDGDAVEPGAILARVEWGMDVQRAVSAPHLVNRFGRYDVEAGTTAEALTGPLEALGYEVRAGALTSGLHAISLHEDGLRGGADPRREGVALGD